MTSATITSINNDLPLVTMYEGDSGPNVTLLQRKLSSLGIYHGEPTGYFGALTQAALQMLQRYYGLAETGCFDIPTWYALTFWDCCS